MVFRGFLKSIHKSNTPRPVTTMELGAKLAEAGIEIDRKKIQLEEPIKNLGEYEVPVKLPAGITATFKVKVVPAE